MSGRALLRAVVVGPRAKPRVTRHPWLWRAGLFAVVLFCAMQAGADSGAIARGDASWGTLYLVLAWAFVARTFWRLTFAVVESPPAPGSSP